MIWEILTRPGRLTENEFTLVKPHPQVVHDILSPVDFGRPIADVVLQLTSASTGRATPAA